MDNIGDLTIPRKNLENILERFRMLFFSKEDSLTAGARGGIKHYPNMRPNIFLSK